MARIESNRLKEFSLQPGSNGPNNQFKFLKYINFRRSSGHLVFLASNLLTERRERLFICGKF